ncbi:MAG: hypothetical protein ORN56_00230 [Chitinophagales bacterium]|nr:hypothetical protein [Chitinophagales bacterium]
MKRLFCFLLILLVAPEIVMAQLSGNYTIGPTQPYTNIASIISALNIQGISNSVTISVPANYVETTPAGGFVLGSTILNASLNSTSTLQFVKSGVGNNPLIYGAPGQYATTNIYGLSDVIWAINGCDYVSVDGIDLCDSTNNSTLATANEIGFGFYKLNASAPFDGCQHNRIQNCSIRLQGYTVTGNLSIKSAGIFVFCKTRNGGTVSSGQVGMVLTNSNDASSFNQFYSNRISGASCGIYLGGSAGTYAYWDTANDIGGNSSSTGNYIYNFGNDGSSLGIYAGFGQSNTNISFNTIDNTLAASPSLSANYLGTLTGISFVAQLTNQIVLNRQVRARGNTISIGYASSITGNYIRRFSGMSFSVSNEDLLIDSNSIYFNNPYAVLTSADCYGIDFGGGNASTKAVVANNKISGFVRLNQNFNGINNFNSNFDNVLVSANDIDVDMESNISSGFYYRGIRVLNASVISNYSLIRNTFHDVQLYTTSNFTAGAMELTFDGCKNLHIDSNVISNFGSSKYGSPVTGISLSYSHLDTFECSYNSISNLKGGYSLIGIWDKPSSFLANVVVDVHHNSIEYFRSTCDDITNVAYYRNANPGSFYFHHNIIKDISDTLFSTQLNQLAGLYFKGDYRDTFKRALIYNNIVSIGNSKAGLNEPSNMIGNMDAILIAKGDHNKLEFVNNTMSVFGVLKNRNAYSSIIRNKGTDTILLKNNILANYCEWDVTYPHGYIADLIFDTSLAVLSSSSNNNSYFLKSLHNQSSTIALIAHQAMDSIGSFLTYVAPRESNSFYEEPPFASMDYLSPNFCQFSSSVMTQNESAGTANLPISLLDDVFGNPRFGAANYTGLGTGLDIGAY